MARDFAGYFLRTLPRMKMLGLMKSDPDMPDTDVTLEYLLDEVWIAGSPDDVTEKLLRLYQEVGGFGVLLAMGHEWQPREAWVESMTLLADEVMPSLADLG